jgi:hypothetical protein
MNSQKISAWAGMIGPIFFVLAFTIEGWLRPGYNPLSMFISELSLGQRGAIQIINFLVFGLFFLVFTYGIAVEFKKKKASKTGSVLFTIIAACYFFSGIFVTDPGTIFAGQKSIHGIIHGIFGGIVFTLMPVSCFVFLRQFRRYPEWKSLRQWTLLAGILITAAVIALTITTKFPSAQLLFSKWFGLIQRLAIIPYMIWLFSFAYTWRKHNTQPTSGY